MHIQIYPYMYIHTFVKRILTSDIYIHIRNYINIYAIYMSMHMCLYLNMYPSRGTSAHNVRFLCGAPHTGSGANISCGGGAEGVVMDPCATRLKKRNTQILTS